MKINEIAKAYGVTKSAVEKWTAQKRQRAIKLLSAGVDPHIMELVGEVQRLCYAASCVLNQTVTLSSCIFGEYRNYNVYYVTDDGDHVSITCPHSMTAESLSNTISKLESIIYGDMK